MTPLWCRRCTALTERHTVWRIVAVWIIQILFCAGIIWAPLVRADTRIIPSLSVSERYDSNVLFTPSGGDTLGKKRWDFVSTAVPGLQIIDKARTVETIVNANVSGNVFVNNPELNFFATQASVSMKLDGLVGQVIPGLKLQIADAFQFTPEAPSFVPAGAPAVVENVFARGIQMVRANTITNGASVIASYPVMKSLSVEGMYNYSLVRIGKIFVEEPLDVPVFFFDSDFHRWSIGPTYNLTRGDKIGLDYSMVTARFVEKSTSTTAQQIDESISAHTIEARYATGGLHWTAMTSGGVTVLPREDSTFFSGRLRLSGRYDPVTQVALDLSRQLAPAFFGTAALMISTNVGLTVERRVMESLSISGSANYAINKTTPVDVGKIESYAAGVLLTYNLTRSLATSLSYQYTHFELTGTDFTANVNRSVVLLSLSSLWK